MEETNAAVRKRRDPGEEPLWSKYIWRLLLVVLLAGLLVYNTAIDNTQVRTTDRISALAHRECDTINENRTTLNHQGDILTDFLRAAAKTRTELAKAELKSNPMAARIDLKAAHHYATLAGSLSPLTPLQCPSP